jgi:hypothetical protein
MSNRQLNGTAPVYGFFNARCHAALLSATPDGDVRDFNTTVASIHKHGFWCAMRERMNLRNR